MRIASIALIAGTLLGPVYFFYSEFFSGQKVITARGGLHEIALDPSMNPVGITVEVPDNYDRYSRQYSATLYLGQQLIHSKGFSVSAQKRESGTMQFGTTSVSLGAVKIPSTGTYRLHVIQNSHPDSDMEIKVRRNLKSAKMWVVWTGVALLVAAVLFHWLAGPTAAGEGYAASRRR